MTTADLISRCRASIADDKKHGLTYRTCRAEDFEALVELARMAIEARLAIEKYDDAIAAASEKARGERT